MIMPSKCPVCHDVLLNEYIERLDGGSKLRKVCQNKLNHNITWVSKQSPNYDDIEFIFLKGNPNIVWNLANKEIYVKKLYNTIIPFFEPDFSNYQNLLHKLKTYLLFS